MSVTLENILIQVRELYQQYGMKSITMDDTARHLGISKKTLYRFVENKEDLINKIIDFEEEHLTNGIQRVKSTSQSSVEELYCLFLILVNMARKYNVVTIYDLDKYYPALIAKINEKIKNKVLRVVVENLEKGMDNDVYRKDLNIDITSQLFLHLLITIMQKRILTNYDINNQADNMEVIKFYLAGITSETGKELIQHLVRNKTNEINT